MVKVGYECEETEKGFCSGERTLFVKIIKRIFDRGNYLLNGQYFQGFFCPSCWSYNCASVAGSEFVNSE